MKNTGFKVRTRLVSMLMAVLLIFSSFVVLTTVSASAETSEQQSEIPVKKLIDVGIDNIAKLITSGDPYAATMGFLSGAFKAFLAGGSHEISTKEIMDKLNEMQAQLTDYYNQEKALLDKIDIKIDELQFKTCMNDLLVYNKEAVGVLSKHLDENIEEEPTEESTEKPATPDEETTTPTVQETENKSRDEKLRDLYNQVTRYTINKEDYMLKANVVANAIISGGVYAKAFDLYEAELRKTTDNADEIKAQLQAFAKLCTGQFIIAYTCTLTGFSAQNKLYTMDENEAGLRTLEMLASQKYEYAKGVTKEYSEIETKVKTIEKCKVDNGKETIPYASFADAFVDVSKMSGDVTLTLSQDITPTEKQDYRYDVSLKQGEKSCFKEGNLYINNKNLNLTLDLNNYSLKRDGVCGYSLIIENGKATVKNGTIDGIKATHSALTVSKVNFTGNSKTALYAEYTPINVSNCKFSGYTDSAVKSYYYSSEINDCVFIDNKGKDGAGLYIKNAGSKVNACRFEKCEASSDGGGIYTTGSKITITNTNFEKCKANNGGGMYCNEDATLTDCCFTNCNATDDGGGYCQGYYGDGFTSNFSLTGCQFFYNHANDDGGAIYADSMAYAKLKDLDVRYNKAGSDGAGMYCQKGSGSSCDPDLYGTIVINYNEKDNGTNSNLFLGENSTSKCIVHFHSVNISNSKIGVTSPTNDDNLDITAKQDVDYSSVFFYDTNKYKIHGYKGFWGGRYVEIVKR